MDICAELENLPDKENIFSITFSQQDAVRVNHSPLGRKIEVRLSDEDLVRLFGQLALVLAAAVNHLHYTGELLR